MNATEQRFLRQSSFLTVGTFIFFLLFYGLPVANAVIATYYAGGDAFIKRQDPYQATLKQGTGNQFKYSPLFALAMAGMAKVKFQPLAVGGWILLNMGAFFFGLCRWVNLSGKLPIWMAVAVIACLLELTYSLILTQVNALIIGLLLIGLADYRDGRLFRAGGIIMLATNLKVYPVIFLVGLASRRRPAFWAGALVIGLLTFLLPAFAVGWAHNLNTHLAWGHVVLGDAGASGILDILSAFIRLGFPTFGHLLRNVVFVITVPVFFSYVFFAPKVDWRLWLTFGISALLLLSPRTEVFTYVLLAPSYLLMTSWCPESKKAFIARYGAIACAIFALLITSCQFTSSQWLNSFAPIEICRIVGGLGFWTLSGAVLCRNLIDLWKPANGIRNQLPLSAL